MRYVRNRKKGGLMRYQVGDKVITRSWEALEIQFESDEDTGVLNIRGNVFRPKNKYLCGQSYKITSVEPAGGYFVKDRDSEFLLYEEMILGHDFKWREEIEVSYDDISFCKEAIRIVKFICHADFGADTKTYAGSSNGLSFYPQSRPIRRKDNHNGEIAIIAGREYKLTLKEEEL